MLNKPKYILVHCTDVSEKTIWDQFVSVNKYHQSREFSKSRLGYYVGYHRLITGGKNYKAREDDEEGCHCNTSQDGLTMNLQSLGICIGFDGDIEHPNPAHYKLAREQILAWKKQYNIPDLYIKFHRDFTPYKSCPGSLIKRGWLNELLEEDPETPFKPPSQQEQQDALINIQEQLGILQKLVIKLQELYNLIFKKS